MDARVWRIWNACSNEILQNRQRMGRRPILCLWRGQTGLESSILSACVDLVCLASKNNFLFWIFFRIKAYIWDFSWILVETLRKVDYGEGHRSGVASVLQTCPFGIIKPGHRFDDRSMFGRSPEKSPFLRPSLRSWISQTLKSAKWGHLGKSCGPPRKLILGQKLPLITLLERIFISGAV